MSDYTDQFKNSEFNNTWQSILETINEIDTKGYEADYISNFARFKKIYAFISKILQNIDPDYLPMQEVLNQLPQHAKTCLENLVHVQAGNQSHLNQANQNLDVILNAIKPYAFYDKQIKAALRAAITAYISEINTHLENIADTKTIYDEADKYKTGIAEYYTELLEEDDENHSIKSEISEFKDQATTQTNEIDQFHTRLFDKNNDEAIETKILSAKESAEEYSAEIKKTLADITPEVEELETFYRKIFGHEDDQENKTIGLDEKLSGLFEKLGEYEEEQENKHGQLFDKIEGLLPGATDAGLAKSYQDRKETYEKPVKIWNGVFVACIVAISGFAFCNMQDITDWEGTLKRIIHFAPIYAPIIWLALYATKRRSESRALSEEYAHKEALAKSYSSYKTQIEAIGQGNSELMVKLLSKTIDTISENPSAVLNGKHGDEPPIAHIVDVVKETIKQGK